MSEELKKQAQEKLAMAHKLIDEAAELAEQGGFSISFYDGGDYAPKSGFTEDKLKERALAEARENDPNFDSLSDDDKEMTLEDLIEDLRGEYLREYQEPGQWWLPSRNC